MGGTASTMAMTAGEFAVEFAWKQIKAYFKELSQNKKVSRRELTQVT